MLALLTAVACSDEQKPPENPPPEPTLVTQGFTNPLKISIPTGGLVQNCPDPTVIRGQQEGDTSWYMYCTSDPLNDQDKDSSGKYKQHFIPMLKSSDLAEWTYVGDAFTAPPGYAKPDTDLWAPEVVYFGGKYYLYYTVVDTIEGGSAIGVATSDGPVGPWTQASKPAVEPHEAPCCGGSRRQVFDPEVLITDSGDKYIYYGSYFGGISVRTLSEDGLTSDPYSQVEVTVANRYEAANIIKHGDYYYLLASSTNCCNGPLTGYSVFAGRSRDPWGPFVDREGVRLTANRVGGTPVLGLNGNRWVGTGHDTVITDFGGQDWIVYHAIDRTSPYLAPDPNGDLPPKRQALMDALDWVGDADNQWPVARGGLGASDSEQPAPAAVAGTKSRYSLVLATQDEPGTLITSGSDEFNGTALGSQWTWTRPPAPETFGEEGGNFRFDTQDADLFEGINNASILWEPAPTGNYLVETKFKLNLPPVSCCHNYVQAGLLIHSDDDNYVKLVHFSNWETRQIAFAKEMGPVVPAHYPRYGETFGGPADETVWLRIARRTAGDEETYTAYSSRDGTTWSRAGTWTHKLGTGARIGLISMAGRGFTATFDYVHVSELKN
ncbi:MAG: family 43 glycosylhydrolase [Hyalangium sp.]|uniref:family 43 glycosylhydrolase n=1 Tax=Hyalangium sp. TaxID=2028555 RepID=UPI00389AC265